MAQQLKGKLVEGPYKPIQGNCAIVTFNLLITLQKLLS